ncbi:unnamed protein product, partial [Linum tenue]
PRNFSGQKIKEFFILHCISSLQTHKGKQSRVTSLRSLRSSDSGVSSTGTARKGTSVLSWEE